MNRSLEHASINVRFDHLLNLLGSSRFLNGEGLNQELPFFICPYDAVEHNEMETLQLQLIARLKQQGIKPLQVNLYDVAMNILRREGDFDWIVENEQSLEKSVLLEELQGVLDVEASFVPEFRRLLESHHDAQLLMINGVGEVFPYIRSHNILNNLQLVTGQMPVVMFFPGQYTHSLEYGAALKLFSKLPDDKYYRAFNVYEVEVQ